MANDLQSSYQASKNVYDKIITHKTWWSKLYAKIIWKGADNNQIAHKLLQCIPNSFNGKLLDVPVGTAIFTHQKYSGLKNAELVCLDYSEDMLSIAKNRLSDKKISLMQGDVGSLPFNDENFDIVFSMNGFHVFPDKDRAFSEVTRVLKTDGLLLASFYVKDKGILADFVAEHILAKKGWLSLPFYNECSVRQRLSKDFDFDFIHCDGSLLYFCAKKKGGSL